VRRKFLDTMITFLTGTASGFSQTVLEKIARLALALIEKGTVRIAQLMRYQSEIQGYYKIVQRIGQQSRELFTILFQKFCVYLFSLFPLYKNLDAEIYLVIDTTTFPREKSRKTDWIGDVYDDRGGVIRGIRVVVICAILRISKKKWIRFPLGFEEITGAKLDQTGCSQNQVIIRLIEDVLRRLVERGFQKEKIVLIGDREFGGRQIEAAVKRLGIRYVLRRQKGRYNKESFEILSNLDGRRARRVYRIRGRIEEFNSFLKSRGVDFCKERFLGNSYFRFFFSAVLAVIAWLMLLALLSEDFGGLKWCWRFLEPGRIFLEITKIGIPPPSLRRILLQMENLIDEFFLDYPARIPPRPRRVEMS